MIRRESTAGTYLRLLQRAAGGTVRVFEQELRLSRRAAAEAYSASAALTLAGLARHQRAHPERPHAVSDLVRTHARPADLRAPDVGVTGKLQNEGEPSVDELLGDAGRRTAAWIAQRTRSRVEDVERAMLAAAPLSLGALAEACTPVELTNFVAEVPDGSLEDPNELLGPADACGETFRSLRRRGYPWWVRALGVEG